LLGKHKVSTRSLLGILVSEGHNRYEESLRQKETRAEANPGRMAKNFAAV